MGKVIEIESIGELVEFADTYESMGEIDYRLNPHMILFHIFFALRKKYGRGDITSEDGYACVRIKTREDFHEVDSEYLTLHLLTKRELIFKYYLFVGTNLRLFIERHPFQEKIKIRSEDDLTQLSGTNISCDVLRRDYRYIRASTTMIGAILDIAEKILSP